MLINRDINSRTHSRVCNIHTRTPFAFDCGAAAAAADAHEVHAIQE